MSLDLFEALVVLFWCAVALVPQLIGFLSSMMGRRCWERAQALADIAPADGETSEPLRRALSESAGLLRRSAQWRRRAEMWAAFMFFGVLVVGCARVMAFGLNADWFFCVFHGVETLAMMVISEALRCKYRDSAAYSEQFAEKLEKSVVLEASNP